MSVSFAENSSETRAKATKPRPRQLVLCVEAANPALDLLGQQLRDAGVRNISLVVAPSLASEKPELFEGVWYTDSNLQDMASGFGHCVRNVRDGVVLAARRHRLGYAQMAVMFA